MALKNNNLAIKILFSPIFNNNIIDKHKKTCDLIADAHTVILYQILIRTHNLPQEVYARSFALLACDLGE